MCCNIECLYVKRVCNSQFDWIFIADACKGIWPAVIEIYPRCWRKLAEVCITKERSCHTSVKQSMEIHEPFLSDGFVSLNSDFAQSTPITIL